ncbi:hypothetical protein ATO6_15360 [Oceanicola sp. 22II-s10i]|uniref:DUF3168 domain-containing protein n=1 Tax=Oceanicola sp. 22II-s10i TaxID=1317116 RepID=UPI000B528A02|nr:DUF3168 domain-containing protein [Oceanicola sp. 22II-s10i]OWU83809.1 hypothetical protein ATO6_15360 [Oceanicola sp. 22II-s10i]
MADGPATALQKALVTALKADTAVAALVGARVYDEPPGDVTRPYVRIGNLETRPFRTDGCMAWSMTFSIEVHSRPLQGRIEAARIGEAVIAALDEQHDDIAVTGFTHSWCQFVTAVTNRDADGQSYRTIAAFETVLDVPA